MASWVVVALDTTPPSFSVDSITPASAGDSFTVSYTLSDGEVAGVLHLYGGVTVTGSVVGDTMVFDVPADTPQGNYTVTFTAVDDVLNEIVVTEELSIESEVEPPAEVAQGAGSVGDGFTYGGGPWMQRFDIVVPGTVQLERGVEFQVPGRATLRALPRVDLAVHGTVQRSVPFEATFSATRTEASRWSRLAQEDEEILLSL